MKADQKAYNSNKMLKHLDRLQEWAQGNFVFPIMLDFDLTNICNNRCPGCIGARNENNTTVETDVVKNIIQQLSEVGLKAIIFAGGGDPTCHKDLEEIIKFTKQSGIEVAINTNGYELSNGVINAIAKYCTWTRVSIDADSPEMYKKTHGMPKEAFYQVLDNITRLIKTRNELESNTTIGTCFLIGPQTVNGIYNAAEIAKGLGADNIRFRPFANWNKRKDFTKEVVGTMTTQLKKAKGLSDEQFLVSYPKDRCETIIEGRTAEYKDCLVPNFITAITPDLKLYSCCRFKNVEKHCIGDLNEKSFKEIWLSPERIKVHQRINIQRDCPNPCMYEKYNDLLHMIKEKIPHLNFL